MVEARAASAFWAAVEDCLVGFHGMQRETAAEMVTSFWRRLPQGPVENSNGSSFADMIYHSEPWYIACNLADRELPLRAHQAGYNEILKQNHLG